MIYVCVTSNNHMQTIGLLLWKVRQVFTAFPREYQLLVADDAPTDESAELLERYQRVLPVTLFRNETARGTASCTEMLLKEALRRTDRPKRDVAVVIPPDFCITPDAMPDLLKRIESGADVVVGESLDRAASFPARLVRRSARWLLRPGVRVPGVRDLLSEFCALRLITLKLALRNRSGALLESEGVTARAELIARAAAEARQIATVPVGTRPVVAADSEASAWRTALQLFRAGRRLQIPAPSATA